MGYRRVQIVFFVLILRLGDNLPTAPTTNDDDNNTTYCNNPYLHALVAVSECAHVQVRLRPPTSQQLLGCRPRLTRIYCHQKECNKLCSTFHPVFQPYCPRRNVYRSSSLNEQAAHIRFGSPLRPCFSLPFQLFFGYDRCCKVG